MNIENSNAIIGLSLNGTVSQRSRKFIGGEKMEVVTYLVPTNNGCCFLDKFLSQSCYRAGDQIPVPVNCHVFVRMNNRPNVSFTVCKDYGITLSSEDF